MNRRSFAGAVAALVLVPLGWLGRKKPAGVEPDDDYIWAEISFETELVAHKLKTFMLVRPCPGGQLPLPRGSIHRLYRFRSICLNSNGTVHTHARQALAVSCIDGPNSGVRYIEV